jgi:hypothetical protein
MQHGCGLHGRSRDDNDEELIIICTLNVMGLELIIGQRLILRINDD